MKAYIKVLALSTVILTSACKDTFLEEKPFSSYTPVTLNDSLGFEASLVGLYNPETRNRG